MRITPPASLMARQALGGLEKTPATDLRSDFKSHLEKRLTNEIRAMSEQPNNLAKEIFDRFLTDGEFDYEKLPNQAKRELVKLENAAEDFEAYFIKGLLQKMRATSFSEEDSQMTQLAKDMMDDAISKTTAQSGSSVGIAKTVFEMMSDRVVKSTVAQKD